MCGRIAITTDMRTYAARFGIEDEVQRAVPRLNIKPTETLPIVALGADGQRKFVPARWWLVPHWSKTEKLDGPTFNARAESIAQKPTWKPSFDAQGGRGGRCLIPWDAFYEWSGPKGQRQAHTISLRPSNRYTAFAGLWAAWRPPEAGRDEPPMISCAIITVPANAAIAKIHDRMPAILDQEAWPLWLSEQAHNDRELLDLLQPYPEESMLITAGGPPP